MKIATIETECKWNDQDYDPIGDILAMKKAIKKQTGYINLRCPYCGYQWPNHWKNCIQNARDILTYYYENHND